MNQIKKTTEYALVIALIVIFGIITYQRNFTWKNELTLWSDTAMKSPGKGRPHNNLGIAYLSEGDPDRAIVEINRALATGPTPYRHVALGNAYRYKGWINPAITQYRNALSLKPDYAEVYVLIGNAYAGRGLMDKAIAEYKKTIKLKPSYLEAYVNLASAYGSKGLYKKTIHELEKALQIDPNNPDVHFNLGVTYYSMGQTEKAASEYRKVLIVRPNDPEALRNLNAIKNRSFNPK